MSTRNEIENRIKIIRDLEPATTEEQHRQSQHEFEQLATALAQWAEALTVQFEGFETAQAMHETDRKHEPYPLYLAKEYVEEIAVLFGF